MSTSHWHILWFSVSAFKVRREGFWFSEQIWALWNWFLRQSVQQPAVRIDIWRKASDKTHSASVLLRISHRLKVTVWESSIDPLPHHPTKNTRCAPTLWLSIFHFCTLRLSFLFVLSYYYYQGNFSSHPLTQRVPLPQHHDAGVSQHFSDRGRTPPTVPPQEEGGYPTGPDACTETSGLPSARLNWGKVCLSAIRFPQRAW